MNKIYIYLALSGFYFKTSQVAYAEKKQDSEVESKTDQDKTIRKFNDVLNDLLNEFAYDLKEKNIPVFQNASIRKVVVSEQVPKTYETYLESLTAEKMRKYSKTKLISCSTCRTKKTVLDQGKVTISSPINNQAELDKIAEQLSIETWVDVALLYQESGMLLGFNVFDSKTKELLWTKVYNSENLYKETVDGEEIEREPLTPEEKPKDVSHYSLITSVGWSSLPNVKKNSNMLNVGLRLTEKFNNGHSEVGALVMGMFAPRLFIKNYDGVDGDPAASGEVTLGLKKETINPFPFGLGTFAVYAHNFYEGLENPDSFRLSMSLAAGAIAAKGYFTFIGRAGLGMKLGKSFFIEGAGLYSAPTTLRIKNTYEYKTKGGLGGDITFGVVF